MKDARLQIAFGGLHPDRVRDLYSDFGPVGTLRRLLGGGIKTTDRVRSAVAVPAAARRSELAVAGVEIVFHGDGTYPQHMADLPDAPDLLFLRGKLPHQPGVAVVGTRRCTAYGRRLASAYGRAVAAAGWPTVSGLARGIDGAAHEGTVAGGGIGVAVLGSGIDVMYPREHAELALEVLSVGGAVISEAPPGTPPEAWRFPPRNRIISGLAAVVVVVEATVKGGALITAELALRHGRQVFAVPGDIGRASSEGCNLLIRDGAFPVMSPDDLIESLELVLGPAPGKAPAASAASSAAAALDVADQQLVELISSGTGGVDYLLDALDLAAGEGLARLGDLELRGLIRADGPGRYVAI
jgi:DNA processing protein